MKEIFDEYKIDELIDIRETARNHRDYEFCDENNFDAWLYSVKNSIKK